MPVYNKYDIAGFRTGSGLVLCPNCYDKLFGSYFKEDEVITDEEIEEALAICDECHEQM